MNSYIDYEYYSKTYGGNLIPQEQFEKFAKGASYEVRLNIHNKDFSDYEEDVKTATCSVADILYNQFLNKEKIQRVINTSEKIITSEKVGDFQRNFSAVSIADLITLASDSNVQKKIKAEIEKYLFFTGLLYGGMNVR